jgi:hypothetical protein
MQHRRHAHRCPPAPQVGRKLVDSAKDGNLERCRKILDKYPKSVAWRDRANVRPLPAGPSGLSHDAHVCRERAQGFTAMHTAAMYNRTAIMELLAERGSPVNTLDGVRAGPAGPPARPPARPPAYSHSDWLVCRTGRCTPLR